MYGVCSSYIYKRGTEGNGRRIGELLLYIAQSDAPAALTEHSAECSNALPPEFLPAEIGLSLYPGSSFNPRTSDLHWIRSTRPCSPRGTSASRRIDTKPVNYCDIALL